MIIIIQIALFIATISYICLYALTSRFDHVEPDQQKRRVGIVLGAALWNNQPSPALAERLDQAIDLYKKGQIDYLILSGGLGNDQITEAQGMKNYLTQRGLPSNRLILEDQSSNTKENLLHSEQIIRKNKWGEVYLITHDYHMHRALAYAKRAGIQAAPAPVHSSVLWMPYHKTRECLALIKLKMFNE